MIKQGSIIVILALTLNMKSQETKPNLEFGSTLITLNSLSGNSNYSQGKPAFELINGIFFRYHFKRYSIRFLSSYTENSYDHADPPEVADGISQQGRNKDFRFGGGFQFNILKTKDLWYAYADLLYRNVRTEGSSSGGISGSFLEFKENGNGIDSFFGMGLHCRLVKNLYISPELGFNVSALATKRTETTMIGLPSSSFSAYNVNVNHIFKLHMTVRF